MFFPDLCPDWSFKNGITVNYVNLFNKKKIIMLSKCLNSVKTSIKKFNHVDVVKIYLFLCFKKNIRQSNLH